MAVDLKKNKDSLLKAYNDVVSDNSGTNWVIFGYEGSTTALKVVETGDNGIQELADELNSGHIQYAYCRVVDPNTDLPKYVLVNWQGEGAQDSFKLKYATHLKDIQAFLKMVHVTINARTDADIDEDDIVKKVAKSSGANYSFHKEKAKPIDAPAPVGTNYQRVMPNREIDAKNRDKFWAQTEKEEVKRRELEAKRTEEENKKLDQERKEREDRQQKDSYHDEEERRHRSDQMRKQRQAEASSLVSSTTSSARDFFKQKSVERPDADARRAPPPPRKIKSDFLEQQQKPEEPPKREPIQIPKSEPLAEIPPSSPFEEEEPYYVPETSPYEVEPEPEPQPAYEPEPEPAYEPEPEPAYEPEPPLRPTELVPQVPQGRNLLQQGLPARQNSEEAEEEQNWDEQPQEDFSPPEQKPSQIEDVPSAPGNVTSTEGQGSCARALYDYQATDDTEISFDPGDIITNIDQIDEGWWQGFAPDGSYGMFPSNYVELI
ncbi:drebrin-like protein isoform X2 [Pomacea canaliculata]|uniref:drebrin-like protein isoform X2 n=1 Tax=Pomacea canaliculata TaxID=400727 RepID=UPI000D7289D0|nr:drebrin-like protein isoform X2 [Pomacea canaliculata]